MPFWLEGISHFPLAARNDTYAGFFVGLCRPHSSAWVAGVAQWLLWLEPSGTLSAGFPPSAVPLLNAGRLPLVPLLKYGSFEQLLDKQTGALLALPPFGAEYSDVSPAWKNGPNMEAHFCSYP